MNSIILLLKDFILNIIVSGVVVTVTSKLLCLDNIQELFLGLLLFISILLLQLNLKITQLLEDLQGSPSVRDFLRKIGVKLDNLSDTEVTILDLNDKLKNVSEHMRAISIKYGSNDIWLNLYQDKLDKLNSHIKRTVINDAYEFEANNMQIRNHLFNSSYRGRKGDNFWALTSCNAVNSFKVPDRIDFLRSIDLLFQTKKVLSIRRVFIYDNTEDLENPLFQLFFQLHKNSQYECKVISSADLDSIYRDFGDPSLFKNFGIHGSQYIWETPPENMVSQIGIMNRDSKRHLSYRNFYDTIWNNALEKEVSDNEILDLCKNKRIGKFKNLANKLTHK